MARGLLALLCLAVLAGVVLAGAATAVAPVLLKPRLEAAASRSLGRSVTIGRLQLRPAWPPTLVGTEVAVDSLGTIQSVAARFAARSLFGSRPTITVLTLVHPTVQWRPAGMAARPGSSRAQPDDATPASVSNTRPARLTIERVDIQDGRVEARNPRTGTLDSVAVSGTWQAGTWQAGTWQAGTWQAADAPGQVSHRQAAQRRPTSLALVATAAGATLTASGTVTPPRYDLQLALRADRESALAALFGVLPAAAGPLEATAHAVGDRDHVGLADVTIAAPQGQLGGDAQVTLGAHPHLTGTLRSQRLDLDAILSSLAAVRPRRSPPPAPGSPPPGSPPLAVPPSPWLIPDRPLPLAALARADVDVILAATVLHVGGVDYRDLAGHVVLHDGQLAVQPFAAVLPGGGRLEAALHADAGTRPATAALTLHAPALAVAPILAALRWPDSIAGTASLDADLHSTGATLHQLAAGLDGTAALRLAEGSIDSRAFAALLRAARLPVGLPPGQTRLTCAALGFAAHAGVLQVAPLVADSDRLRVEGAGSVDLGRETLALNLHPLLRTGIGLVIPVQVSGPWRAPRIAVGVPSDLPASAACPADTPPAVSGPGKKHPKPIDLLRALLR